MVAERFCAVVLQCITKWTFQCVVNLQTHCLPQTFIIIHELFAALHRKITALILTPRNVLRLKTKAD